MPKTLPERIIGKEKMTDSTRGCDYLHKGLAYMSEMVDQSARFPYSY